MTGLIALGALAAFIVWFILRRSKNNNQQSRNASRRSYKSDWGNDEYRPFIVKIVDQGWHAQEDKHHSVERFYWRLAFGAAFITSVAAAFAAVFSFQALLASWKAVYEARKTTEQTRRQADIAQAALDSSERPWISIVKISRRDLNVSGETYFDIIEKNYGKTPNVGIETHVDIVPNGAWPDGVKSICKKYANLSAEQKKNSFGVVPDGTFLTGARAPISPEISNAHVVGCITYEWRGQTHHSGFVAAIYYDQITHLRGTFTDLYPFNVGSD